VALGGRFRGRMLAVAAAGRRDRRVFPRGGHSRKRLSIPETAVYGQFRLEFSPQVLWGGNRKKKFENVLMGGMEK